MTSCMYICPGTIYMFVISVWSSRDCPGRH